MPRAVDLFLWKGTLLARLLSNATLQCVPAMLFEQRLNGTPAWAAPAPLKTANATVSKQIAKEVLAPMGAASVRHGFHSVRCQVYYCLGLMLGLHHDL